MAGMGTNWLKKLVSPKALTPVGGLVGFLSHADLPVSLAKIMQGNIHGPNLPAMATDLKNAAPWLVAGLATSVGARWAGNINSMLGAALKGVGGFCIGTFGGALAGSLLKHCTHGSAAGVGSYTQVTVPPPGAPNLVTAVAGVPHPYAH